MMAMRGVGVMGALVLAGCSMMSAQREPRRLASGELTCGPDRVGTDLVIAAATAVVGVAAGKRGGDLERECKEDPNSWCYLVAPQYGLTALVMIPWSAVSLLSAYHGQRINRSCRRRLAAAPPPPPPPPAPEPPSPLALMHAALLAADRGDCPTVAQIERSVPAEDVEFHDFFRTHSKLVWCMDQRD